jgi:GTP-binding protein
VTGDGIQELSERLAALTRDARFEEPERQPFVVLRPGRPRFTVSRTDDGRWRVAGRSVERWVSETDLEDEREVERLQRRLKKEGVDRKLTAMGAHPGDDVEIRGRVFEFVPDPAPATDAESGTGASEGG